MDSRLIVQVIERPASTFAELLLQRAKISHIPVLGELVAVDEPDVDGVDRNLLAGRRHAEKSPAMGSAPSIAGDDLVATENAVLNRNTKVGKGLASALQPAMLRIGLGEPRLQRGGVAGINCCHVAIA